jgi:CubicO group peptidase (beta-lactamase class C family)
VLHGGRTVLEHYWAPYEADDRTLVYSCSKTLSATAVGLAVAEGRFALNDRVVDLLPDAAPVPADEVVSQITVHHLLSMSTGHTTDTIDAITVSRPRDWARRILAVRPQAPVGSVHVYNNGASFLLGEIVRTRTGEDLLDYLTPRVLAPMGIAATWDRDQLGRCLGWTGAHLTTSWLAAFGELYRCDGVWNGVRLLPEGWVERATTRHIPTTDEVNPDWSYGYGYQLWRGREGYRLDGAFGQFSLVLPERDLVIGITSGQSENQHLLDVVWDVLLPELEAGASGSGFTAGAALADSGQGKRWAAAAPVLDPTLTPPTDKEPALPRVTDVSAERGDSGFTVGFTTEASRVTVQAPATWQRQHVRIAGVDVPVAARGGVGPDGSLLVEITFTETPHTLRVRLRPDASAGMAWSVPPLQTAELSHKIAV